MNPARTLRRPPIPIPDLVAELTRAHRHSERYEHDRRRKQARYHVTRVPSLLAQLERTEPTGADDEGHARGFESKPAARLEAIDVLVTIDHEATRWLTALHVPHHGDTADRVRRLAAQLPRLDPCPRRRLKDRCCDFHAIEHDLRRWYTQARVTTGWDAPAWRPDSTCPLCGEHRTLRVKWLDEVGFCTSCGETWDSTTIGLLADHIRDEAAETRQRRAILPCFCPLPQPEPTTFRLCPTCGSARCHRALTVQPLAPAAPNGAPGV